MPELVDLSLFQFHNGLIKIVADERAIQLGN